MVRWGQMVLENENFLPVEIEENFVIHMASEEGRLACWF